MKQQIKNKTWLLWLALLPLLASNCKKSPANDPNAYIQVRGEQSFGAYLNGQPYIPDYRDAGYNIEPFYVDMLVIGRFPSSSNYYHYIYVRGRKQNSRMELYIPPPNTR
jgi:hypothetical protein